MNCPNGAYHRKYHDDKGILGPQDNTHYAHRMPISIKRANKDSQIREIKSSIQRGGPILTSMDVYLVS